VPTGGPSSSIAAITACESIGCCCGTCARRRASRNRIQKWIEAGDVLINGAVPSQAAWRVQAGDDLRIRVADLPAAGPPGAEAIALEILYEDDDLLAVNKPAGMSCIRRSRTPPAH
jgi:23S rRNA-/tRNA-specific pseudouridylate synthase